MMLKGHRINLKPVGNLSTISINHSGQYAQKNNVNINQTELLIFIIQREWQKMFPDDRCCHVGFLRRSIRTCLVVFTCGQGQ